jgi:hypothetical protein
MVELILELVDLDHEADEVVDGDPTKDLVGAELVELMQLLQPLQLCPQVGARVDDRLHITIPENKPTTFKIVKRMQGRI